MQTKKKPTRRTFILNSTSINTGDSRLHLENYKLDVIKRNVKFDPGMHPPECNKYREVVKIQFHWNFTARDPSFMRNQCEKGNTHTHFLTGEKEKTNVRNLNTPRWGQVSRGALAGCHRAWPTSSPRGVDWPDADEVAAAGAAAPAYGNSSPFLFLWRNFFTFVRHLPKVML